MWMLLVSLAVSQVPACEAGEVVVLSCRAKAKQLAVCAGPAAAPTYLQYRFGPPGKPELVFPAERAGSIVRFHMSRRLLATGDEATLTFTSGATSYEVYTQTGKDGGAGVNVSTGGKVIATVACTGPVQEQWETVEPLLNGATPNPTSTTNTTSTTTAKPDPLAGKSQRDICNDDALLLLEHDFNVLRFEQGFQKACCHKGALGDDDRCQLDWPGGDVPACSEVDLLRNRLFALYGYVFKEARYQKAFAAEAWYRPRADFTMSWLPPAAQRNVARLKAMTQKGGCVADVDECGPAGVRWSLDLQRDTKGQVDGMQQSEMAEVITARCRAGWPPGMASCLAAGTGKECVFPLPADERKALWSELHAISPDVR